MRVLHVSSLRWTTLFLLSGHSKHFIQKSHIQPIHIDLKIRSSSFILSSCVDYVKRDSLFYHHIVLHLKKTSYSENDKIYNA